MLLEISPEISSSLDKAEQWLAEGRWRKAERACDDILQHHASARAAFLRGRVCVASGESARALDHFRQAIGWDPQNAAAHFALAELEQVRGELREAAQSWINGLEIDPTYVAAHVGLADVLLRLGLPDSAMIAAKQALLVDDSNELALQHLARAAELCGDFPSAMGALEKCRSLQPHSVEPLWRLAKLHLAFGNAEQSGAFFQKALQLEPRRSGLRFEYSGLLTKVGDRAGAIAQLREAVRLKPHFPEALSNLGLLLRADLKFDDAEAAYKKACAQQPGFAAAWNNLANLRIEQVRLEEAEHCYTMAITANPDYAEAHTGRAMLRLLTGRFEEGWSEYEWRWRQPGVKQTHLGAPEWDGSDLAKRTILLHAEQGAGDTIQFIRYARLLKMQGARIITYCPRSLRSLIETIWEIDQVVCDGEVPPPFDVHAPLLSLPRLCGTNLANIPAEVPYLSIPTSAKPPDVLAASNAPLRVGLVWAGNPNHHNDRNRSIPPALLQPLLKTMDVQFFSLQLGGEPLPDCDTATPVLDLAPFLTDYATTAACLQHLDLLITVDTSVAHLAGALGRPLWMMLPACNDWRWLLQRPDSPWYPSMRIFRQTHPGDWGNVLSQIQTECAVQVAGKQN